MSFLDIFKGKNGVKSGSDEVEPVKIEDAGCGKCLSYIDQGIWSMDPNDPVNVVRCPACNGQVKGFARAFNGLQNRMKVTESSVSKIIKYAKFRRPIT